ncbi:MAG: hypothetical protein D6681_14310 [Calditrichaeota bacterium]|nr:MAG: hypothetical protein D6681_14310 [Calditrichota bacterium]
MSDKESSFDQSLRMLNRFHQLVAIVCLLILVGSGGLPVIRYFTSPEGGKAHPICCRNALECTCAMHSGKSQITTCHTASAVFTVMRCIAVIPFPGYFSHIPPSQQLIPLPPSLEMPDQHSGAAIEHPPRPAV